MEVKLAINREEFTLLRQYIQQECGILVSEEKVYLIESRLARLVVESGSRSYKEFYFKAKADLTKKLRNKIIDAMTTNETLWFRDEKPWQIIKEIILPEFIAQLRRGDKHKIKIWSAACSTGQEPYSLAMLLHEALAGETGITADQFEILATDISPSALYIALSGRYNNVAMNRGMLPGYKDKYFENVNDVCQIKPEIRSLVTFKQFNLQQAFLRIPMCDLVFCRNVAIYFDVNFKSELFRKVHSRMNSDAFLFLGATETLRGVSADFEQFEYQRGFYYKPFSR